MYVLSLGYSLCEDCRRSFDEIVKSKEEPTCLNEPECRCATFECASCLKQKMSEYGFFKSYRMKTYGMKMKLGSCWLPNVCCVCQEDSSLADHTQFMDLTVCMVLFKQTYIDLAASLN